MTDIVIAAGMEMGRFGEPQMNGPPRSPSRVDNLTLIAMTAIAYIRCVRIPCMGYGRVQIAFLRNAASLNGGCERRADGPRILAERA